MVTIRKSSSNFSLLLMLWTLIWISKSKHEKKWYGYELCENTQDGGNQRKARMIIYIQYILILMHLEKYLLTLGTM